MNRSSSLCAAAALTVFSGMAWAKVPVAIVEEVNANSAGVEFMDYVEVGRVIRLAPHETIVIGYFKSCLRETINGGTIVIGDEKSDVTLGKVERMRVACDGGKTNNAGAGSSAGMVFRDRPRTGMLAKQKPQQTVFGLSPVVETLTVGTLTIDRIDLPGEHHEVRLRSEDLLRGVFYDLAKTGTELTAGGLYRASLNTQETVFFVAASAKSGRAPLLGRILRLRPGS